MPHWQVGRSWLKFDSTKMWCETCKVFGKNKSNIQSQMWFEGTSNFKIDTIKAHEKSTLHIESAKAQTNIIDNPAKSEGVSAIRLLNASNLRNLRYMFRNAHVVAKHDWSFKDYVVLCELDKAKELDTGVTYQNDKSCREFIHHIAMVESENTSSMLSEGQYFSITIDGATDVSGTEQESIYVHYAHKGERHQRFIRFVSPESTTSEHIHDAVLDTLKKNNIDVKKIVGTTTDGASNMMGAKKGFTTLMKQSSPDLVSIHCLAHRLELAVKDSIKGNITVKKSYDRLMTLLIGLYYFYKKSPKQRKLLQKTFEILKVPTVFPTRAGGTRWIPHTLKAISVLMKSYEAITTQLQDASHSVPKAEGLVKLATDVNLFAFMMVMQDVLEPVNTLSMHLQSENPTIADAFFMMETAKELIQSYGNDLRKP